jgi:hypothetical protein
MQCTIDNNTVVRLQHCDVQCGAGFMLLKVNALGTYTAARHSHVTAPDRAPSQALTHSQYFASPRPSASGVLSSRHGRLFLRKCEVVSCVRLTRSKQMYRKS